MRGREGDDGVEAGAGRSGSELGQLALGAQHIPAHAGQRLARVNTSIKTQPAHGKTRYWVHRASGPYVEGLRLHVQVHAKDVQCRSIMHVEGDVYEASPLTIKLHIS